MAEGAGMLVLEEYEHACRRGAAIYAEVLGYGTTNDAYSMTAPREDGAQASRAMRLALQDAGCAVGELGYLNAHGSATPLNDKYESLAIRNVGAQTIPVSSTKSMHGHALGASGAIELAICSQVFGREWLPPSLNVFEKDPDCRDLDVITDGGRKARVGRILSNSFGFGGINACMVLGRV